MALPACQTGADRRRHVLRRAQTALDFCRCHAKCLQLIQLIDDRVVLQGQVVQTARLTLRQSVCLKGQSAGTCTGAAVAAAPAQKSRHIALTADAHAQCTMHKALGLDAAVLRDVLHLRQAQLPGQHHPGEAQLFELQCALQAVHAHLCGAVAGQLRRDPADQSCHRQILTDDRICPAGGNGANGRFQRRQLPAVDGSVQCHMHGHAPGMAEAHRIFQRVCIKIVGTGAGIEARKSQIHCIGPAEHGGT